MAHPGGTPYVGPRTFEEKESRFFFGREREARDLLWLVISEPLVLFYAPSGAGKSSLINTRLAPGLRREGFEVLPIGRVGGELPEGIGQVGNIFVFNLLLSLDRGHQPACRLTHTSLDDYLSSRETAQGQGHQAEGVEHGEGSLDDAAYAPTGRVLIIDQFEEIVTAHLDRWQERDDFFQDLSQALSQDPLLWVVLTLREDYVAALDPYARLLPDKLRARFYMQRMGYQAALEAVKKPAEANGRPFAAGVAETLVDNLRQIRVQGQAEPQPGEFVEPVQLQVVCYQLWENLKARPPAEITHQNLQELGDVDTALAQFYEQAIARVLEETGGSEIELRRWFDRQLITEAGTRGTVYRGAEKTGGLANRTVELLANRFLLRAEIRSGGTWYELVHDRFIEPIWQANLDWRERQSGLIQAALAWDGSGRAEDNLYRGRQLIAALAGARGQRLEPLVQEFVAASEKFSQAVEEKEARRQRELAQAQALAEAERRRAEERARSARRLLRLAVALAGVFLLAVAAAIFAWTQQQRAQEQERIAREQASAALAAEKTAEARRVEAETAQALAVAAQKEAERSALIARSGQLATQAQTAIVEDYPQRSLLLAVEAVSLTLGADDLRVPAAADALWQTLFSTGGRGLGTDEDAVTALAISPDSRWLVTGGGAATRLWNLHDLNADPLILTLDEGPALTAAFSPDGGWLAVAGGALAHLWDLADLSAGPVVLRSHRDPVTSLAFSPDGRWLVTGGEDRTARVWDLADLRADPTILPVQENPIHVVAVSPDSHWLITVGSFDTQVRVWDLADLDAAPLILQGGEDPIAAIALSPDGGWLAAGAGDTYLWDLTDPDPAATFTLLPGGSFVNVVAFSPDNRWLVTGDQSATTQVWDLASLEENSLPSHQGAITSLAISPDSRWLVTGSVDRTVAVWDLTDLDAEPLILSGHDDAITGLAISPDGHWLVTGSLDRTARVWDLTAPDPGAAAPIVLPGPVDFAITEVAISPDRRWLVTAGEDAVLRLWDLTGAHASTAEGPAPLPGIPSGHQGLITALAISPDAGWLATAGDDAALRLWDLRRAPDLAAPSVVLSGQQGAIRAMAISPDSRWLAAGGDDGAARLWDLTGVDAEATPLVLSGQRGSIYAVAFSSDQRWLLTAGGDGDARLWDMADPDPAATSTVLASHESAVHAVGISLAGRWLATGDDGGLVRLWDVHAPAGPASEPLVLSGHQARITAVTFSPDDRWLVTASADSTARLWDVPALLGAGQTAPDQASASFVLRGHERGILAVAVSADTQASGSRWLATGSFDGTARLWDLTAPDPSSTAIVLRGHKRGIMAAAISPDGHWLVTGSADGTARLWTLRLEELVELACRTAGRNFTPAEWAQFFPGQAYRQTCPHLPAHPAVVEGE